MIIIGRKTRVILWKSFTTVQNRGCPCYRIIQVRMITWIKLSSRLIWLQNHFDAEYRTIHSDENRKTKLSISDCRRMNFWRHKFWVWPNKSLSFKLKIVSSWKIANQINRISLAQRKERVMTLGEIAMKRLGFQEEALEFLLREKEYRWKGYDYVLWFRLVNGCDYPSFIWSLTSYWMKESDKIKRKIRIQYKRMQTDAIRVRYYYLQPNQILLFIDIPRPKRYWRKKSRRAKYGIVHEQRTTGGIWPLWRSFSILFDQNPWPICNSRESKWFEFRFGSATKCAREPSASASDRLELQTQI